MKKVMVFGSFDILHDGHRSLFTQAKKFGDLLVVVVARDKTYEQLRSHSPMHDEQKRLQSVQKELLVDKAILGDLRNVYAPIYQERPDIIALGYDQTNFVDGLKENLAKRNLKTSVVRLQSYKPHEYKSSLIKKKIGPITSYQ